MSLNVFTLLVLAVFGGIFNSVAMWVIWRVRR